VAEDHPILSYLLRAGPRAAGALSRELGIERTRIHRAYAAHRERLLRVGRARATTYALRRAVDGVRTPTRVHEVEPSGRVRHALTLYPVEPMGFYVKGHVAEVESGFHEADPSDLGADPGLDLPWFLLDLKPVGYLGRAWLRAHADHGFPSSLPRWTGDDVLRYAAHYASDLPGGFVVGEPARARLLEERLPTIPRGEEAEHFPRLARLSSEGRGGSSAGGEQPKFIARVDEGAGTVHHITKFSPPMDTPGGRRWADLLMTEHLALQLLGELGIPAARSRILDSQGRRYLLVRRFDRHGAKGRSGLCSLFVFDRSGVAGELHRWSLVTRKLVDQGLLDQAEHGRVLWLEAFGHAIANTDMHLGNLSVHLRGTTITGLAPVYDMLPMFHAPRHGGELPEGLYDASAELGEVPESAREAAAELWWRAATHAQVSESFQRVARAQRELLQ